MRNIKHDDGFTLVEVIVTISVLLIVIVPIGAFMLHNLKDSKIVYDQSEVQQNAQMVMATFREKCIPASGISVITSSSGVNSLNESTENLKFKSLTVVNSPTGETNTFEYDESAGTFKFNGASIAKGINIAVSPLPSGTTYKNCTGIKVKVTSSKNNTSIGKTQKVEIENQFYFRNAN
ncbi:MAG: prepilin-type N-terminal cleavage/methylation domain-containing protein [Clostridia bacterium]|nr:prepilin-type N-terminal cleavage/methylation domain-containing protein [Clostridia bacterium]